MPPEPRRIGDILRERYIELATNDPVTRGGFTQVPNLILKHGKLSLGAEVTYFMFLHLHGTMTVVFLGRNGSQKTWV